MNIDKDVVHRRALRAVAVIVGGVIAASTLAGCGFVKSDDSGGTSSKTLSIALSTEEAAGLKDLIPAFEKESGIHVKVTSAATADLNQQLSVQLTSGTAPDVFRVSPGSSSAIGASLLGAAGKLVPLTDQGWASKLPDSARSLAQSGKNVYALPLSQNEIVMAYNKDVFTKLGLEVPTTWAELLDVCSKLKAAGIVPISAGFTGGIFLQFLVYQLAASNVYAVDPDIDAQQKGSSTAFSSSREWREVFTKLRALQTDGYFTDGANGIAGDQATQAVVDGKAGMIGIVSASLPTMASAASGAGIGVFAMPGTDKASQTRLPVAPDFIAVNAKTKNKDNAFKFLDFLAQTKNATAYADALGSLPGLSVKATIPSQLDGVSDYLTKGLTVPFANYTWPNGDTQQTLLQSGQELIAGKISVDVLLTQLDAQFAKGTP
jgi:raffinose/stachyose/melibiose transport system substrate-binding protein